VNGGYVDDGHEVDEREGDLGFDLSENALQFRAKVFRVAPGPVEAGVEEVIRTRFH